MKDAIETRTDREIKYQNVVAEIKLHGGVLTKLEEQLAQKIVELQKNPKWQKFIVEKWNVLPEEDREKLYLDGTPNKQTLCNMLFSNPVVANFLMSNKYESKRLKLTGFMESPGWRYLVQGGFLKKPEGITDDQLKADLAQDAKDLTMLMDVVEWILSLFAPEAIPELTTAKKIISKVIQTREKIAKLSLEANQR